MTIKNIFLSAFFLIVTSAFSCNKGQQDGQAINNPKDSIDNLASGGRAQEDSGNTSDSSHDPKDLHLIKNEPPPQPQSHDDESSPQPAQPKPKKLVLLYIKADRGKELADNLIASSKKQDQLFGNTILTSMQVDTGAFSRNELNKYDCSIVLAPLPDNKEIGASELYNSFRENYDKIRILLGNPNMGILVLAPYLVNEGLQDRFNRERDEFITKLKRVNPDTEKLTYDSQSIYWGSSDEQIKHNQTNFREFVEKICSAKNAPEP